MYTSIRLNQVLPILISSLFLGIQSFAQESVPTEERKRSDARYRVFAERASAIELATAKGEDLQLIGSPLMKYTRDGGNRLGSVFLWTSDAKRPAAIGTIGCIPTRGAEYMFAELHWLLNEPMQELELSQTDPKVWNFDGRQSALPVPLAPTPADQPRIRLTQMRRMAAEFRGKMTARGRTHELRLLPQPLYRYPDPTQEQDGAIFAMVWTEGTDPELLLHLHTSTEGDKTAWAWQPIRFTWRPLELHHKETRVWKSPEVVSRDDPEQSGPYITTLTERLLD